jgi:glycosyltransferase involved in cell wall biosynthesis
VLAGGVPKHEVPDFLAAADVEAHDLQGYGLGTASLETMAAGVPVVASIDEDNFLDVQLVSGRHLVRVPLGDAGALADALAALITDRDGARRIGRCGRDLVHEHFTLDRVTDLHVALFERLRGSVKSST